MPETEIRFLCCYCNQECDATIQVCLIMNPGEKNQTEQYWFAHYGCFEQALHEKIRGSIETEF